MNSYKMKTYSPKPKDISRSWYVLDASEAPLGRLATASAQLLMGKGKITASPHMDGGDYVIVINSDKLVVTAGKQTKKFYYRHSGFPGGIKKRSLGDKMKQNSRDVIVHAVRGMLPDNKLRKGRLQRLKVYPGGEHGHTAQNPAPLSINKITGSK